MEVADLPEPQPRPPLTVAEKRERQWRVFTTLLWLLIVYSFIHKVGVPFFLKFTRLAITPYAEIDYYFGASLVLGLALWASNNWWVSFLCGFSVAYGCVEVILTAKGANPGWLGFSKLLSSVPQAGVCLAMMTGPYPRKNPRAAWYGVAGLGAIEIIGRLL